MLSARRQTYLDRLTRSSSLWTILIAGFHRWTWPHCSPGAFGRVATRGPAPTKETGTGLDSDISRRLRPYDEGNCGLASAISLDRLKRSSPHQASLGVGGTSTAADLLLS